MNNSIEKHQALCEEIHSLYKKKNSAYGNSFSETYQKLGPISAITRISDKYNRLVHLAIFPNQNEFNEHLDESIRDTLIDLANYALMMIMEMDDNKEE